jgi:hypothetical protein
MENKVRNMLTNMDKQMCLVQGVMGSYIKELKETNPELALKMQKTISSLDDTITACCDLQEILGVALWKDRK